MASLKDLRDRITSVKATQKITKAMQMVAAAKLRKAQEAVEAARPYSSQMAKIISTIAGGLSAQELPALLRVADNPQRYLIIVATAERGLCGGFNTQIARLARIKIESLLAAGKQVSIVTIGKKGADILRREFSSLIIEHISLREVKKIQYKQSDDIATNILNHVNNHAFDSCLFIYSQFKSVIQQVPKILSLLPLDLNDIAVNSEESTSQASVNFEYEPAQEELLEALARHNVSTQIFAALLENVAGEMGAKMSAMDNATRNAGDMINRLSITYNRQRQARITTELIEIIAGAEAL